jgi:hypothetical protein
MGGVNPSKQQQDSHESEPDDATVRVADTISEVVRCRKLSKKEKEDCRTIVHYTFGATAGAIYGATTEVESATASGYGLMFGTALWLGADEIAVPPWDCRNGNRVSRLRAHVCADVASGLRSDDGSCASTRQSRSVTSPYGRVRREAHCTARLWLGLGLFPF